MFGEIKEVNVDSNYGYATVTFDDIVAAFFAQQSLNNFYLSKYNAQLSVKWLTQKPTSTDPSSNQENIST